MRVAFSYICWPLLFAGSLTLVWFGMHTGHGVLVFNVTYLALAIVIALLERVMPHERDWLKNDGQMGVDLALTLLSKSVVQIIIVVTAFMGIAEAIGPHGGGIWPTSWPIALQVSLGLVIAEIGLYWKHRLAHEWPWLWRFHAIHHSVTRLWFFNTGRFHPVDTLTGLAVGMPVLLLLGAPRDTLLMVSAITAIIGILTHSNIEMRCGWLSYVFNTPTLHRWHHSKKIEEGNRNYGENLVLFDQIFGTYFNANRRPPSDIGISHPMPETFIGQLKIPFSRAPL